MPQTHKTEATSRPTRRRPRRRLWAVLAVLLIAPAAVIAHRALRSEPAAEVKTVLVAPGDIELTVTAVGSLKPRDYVDVGAQVSGQLQKILVEIGTRVEKGQLIAEIDPTVYQSRVRTDRANLQNLQAQRTQGQVELELARRQLERNRNMLAERAVSQDTVDQMDAAVKIARAKLQALRAQIEATQAGLEGNLANLGYTRILAPMTGTVTAQEALEGSTVNASQSAPTIVTVANLDVMTAWAQVAEADVNKLQVGMPAWFTTLGAPDQRWRGTVRQVRPTPEIVNDVVLYNVLVDVANPEGVLLPQMTVQVFFVLEAVDDVPVVPLGALIPDPAGGSDAFTVTVLDAHGMQTRKVDVGLRDRRTAQVRSGLAYGDRVVLGQATGSNRQGPSQPARRITARL